MGIKMNNNNVMQGFLEKYFHFKIVKWFFFSQVIIKVSWRQFRWDANAGLFSEADKSIGGFK